MYLRVELVVAQVQRRVDGSERLKVNVDLCAQSINQSVNQSISQPINHMKSVDVSATLADLLLLAVVG